MSNQFARKIYSVIKGKTWTTHSLDIGAFLPVLLAILTLSLSGCSQTGKKIAILTSSQLIASSSPSIHLVRDTLTRDDRERLYRFYPNTLRKIENLHPLNLQDVINMTKAGLEDSLILKEIRATKSQFFLLPEDERSLIQAGVSKHVIEGMRETIDDRY